MCCVSVTCVHARIMSQHISSNHRHPTSSSSESSSSSSSMCRIYCCMLLHLVVIAFVIALVLSMTISFIQIMCYTTSSSSTPNSYSHHHRLHSFTCDSSRNDNNMMYHISSNLIDIIDGDRSSGSSSIGITFVSAQSEPPLTWIDSLTATSSSLFVPVPLDASSSPPSSSSFRPPFYGYGATSVVVHNNELYFVIPSNSAPNGAAVYHMTFNTNTGAPNITAMW